ncbi:MAG: YdcF family protein [Oscillospiraceae bacterium]|nr:YdcF family protein [Oscillospiraceae bacterium]
MKRYVNDEVKKRKRAKITKVSAIVAIDAAAAGFVMKLLQLPGTDILFLLLLTVAGLIGLYLLIWNLCYVDKVARVARIFRHIYHGAMAIGVVTFIILQAYIISASGGDDTAADLIIVLGAGIYGETPSRVLVSRLEAAAEHLEAHDSAIVVVSGGQGSNELITEAEAMYRYLAGRGISEERIFKEEASTSTRENIEFSLEILEEAGLLTGDAQIAIVTSEFHIYRAKRIAKLLGLEVDGIAASTPYKSLRVLYHFREAAALLVEML